MDFKQAADVVGTGFQVVGIAVLGLIVLIRTFLSWSLEVEVNGRWPWRSSRSPNEDASCG